MLQGTMSKKHKIKKYQEIKTKHSDRVEKRVKEIKNPDTIDNELIKTNERTINYFFRNMKNERKRKANKAGLFQ